MSAVNSGDAFSTSSFFIFLSLTQSAVSIAITFAVLRDNSGNLPAILSVGVYGKHMYRSDICSVREY